MLGCGNATGQAQPPFVIFDTKQLNPLWTRGEVPGTSLWTKQERVDGSRALSGMAYRAFHNPCSPRASTAPVGRWT